MSKSAVKQVVLWGLEGGGYGVDPALTNVNAIEVENITCTPMKASTTPRQRAYPTYGASPSAITAVFRELSFDVPLQGSSDNDTPPLYGPVLRSCGLSETITAATKVLYAPISSGQESGAGYFFDDGVKRKLLGSRGTTTLRFPANGLPKANFAMTGLYSPAGDVAFPDVAAQLNAFIDELEVNKFNTVFTIGGFAAPLANLEVVQGNVVTTRDEPNANDVVLTDRNASGSILVSAESVATKDYEALVKAQTLVAIQVIHGTVAGKIVQVDIPKAQLGIPSLQNRNGLRYMQFPLMLVRNLGDDEFTITTK